MAFTHARLRRPARDGVVAALHCAEAPPLAPPESTRRHWSHASLRRMNSSRPNPSGRRACLVSPPVGGKLLPFPRRVGCPTAGGSQSNGAHARTARCTLLRPPPELKPVCSRSRSKPCSILTYLTLQRLAQIGPRHSSLHLNDLSLRLWGAGGGSKARLGLRGAPHRPRNSQTKSLTTRHKLGLSKNYLYTHTGPAPGPGIGGAEFRRRAVAAADASTRGN